jgi:uncharacterized protein YuzE
MVLLFRDRNTSGRARLPGFPTGQVPEVKIIAKIQYGEETDALTITFRAAHIRESDEVGPGTIVDFGHDGGVVGIERLSASKFVEKTREIQFAVGE